MRGTSSLFIKPGLQKGRRPAQEPIPFQEILPLSLKPTVSGKGDKTSENVCIQELTLLLGCLKKHDFNQTACHSEIGAFQKCHKSSMEQRAKMREQEKRGEVSVGSKNLSYKEINQILKLYRQK